MEVSIALHQMVLLLVKCFKILWCKNIKLKEERQLRHNLILIKLYSSCFPAIS